jgi:hypothetical protein
VQIEIYHRALRALALKVTRLIVPTNRKGRKKRTTLIMISILSSRSYYYHAYEYLCNFECVRAYSKANQKATTDGSKVQTIEIEK